MGETIATILRDLPQAKWHQYDPISRTGLAHTLPAGQPIYHLDKADIVVSLESDFLTCGPQTVRMQKDFAGRRRVTDDKKEMNRLYVVESTPTLTGTKADHRLAMAAGEIEGFARQLAAAVGAGAPADGGQRTAGGADTAKWVAALAKDLQGSRGRSVIVAGDYQPAAVHELAQAMNQALGNVGTTVAYGSGLEVIPAGTGSIADLASAMDAGQVELLIILGGINPVYSAPADLKFSEKLTKVGLAVYHGLYVDETANLCHWNIGAAHPLESWGDVRSADGTVTLVQPLIAPLYEGRSELEVLGVLTPQPDRRGYQIVKDYWTRAFGGGTAWTIRKSDGTAYKDAEAFWRHALHDGFIAGTAVADGGPATPFTPAPKPATPVAAASSQLPAGSSQLPAASEPRTAGSGERAAGSGERAAGSGERAAGSGGLELIFRPDPTVWDGRFANNGWLQELPKPLTKITWDTSAWISPALAHERGLTNGDVIELKYRGNTARMPVWVTPGHPQQSVTVFLGYGRAAAGRVGTAANDATLFNANLLRTSDAPWFGNGLEISKTGDRYLLATTQEHHLMEGRAPVRDATLEQYKAEPHIIQEMGHRPPKTLTMHPEHRYDGYKWGMAIDLTTCTGCSACTIACVAENNIPVVGKEQVAAGREMHWIRVDHYFAGTSVDEAVESYHQPVPCMHCENAPCELVCPVAATTHSAEGLNDMVYNRCVGTRYCSNNCPYKVRRFNFLLYQDWTTPSLEPMRNPDVTVRSRGVMEKCTYCVQRINQARIDAKREDRTIRDGEVVTACQSVCPSDAIVFGDLNDPNSAVSKATAQDRSYGILEDLNTRPRTTYLGALRNPNPELESPRAGQHTTTEH